MTIKQIINTKQVMTIKDLNPKNVWANFYSLTRIPRPSKKEGKAIEFIYEFGKKLGLETIKDEVGNVIIRKPATPGMENRKGIILQAHIDMVPQKNADKVHDFEKDPIETRVIDGWVWANGTTLGADNGLGVAVAMSILEDKTLKHGPIEALITMDEETGMTGARALKSGILKGDILINLDSETEGELYVGCAGGLDVTAELPYSTVPVPAGMKAFTLAVTGLKGGHSGMDIVLYRANANKVLVRVLLPMLKEMGVKVSSIEGGSLRNAIPREAFAEILVPAGEVAAAEELVKKVCAQVRSEYSVTDPEANVELRPSTAAAEVIEETALLKMVRAAYACPNGVARMSDSMPGLVETSNNMAIFRTEDGKLVVKTLMRSSVDTAKDDYAQSLVAVFELAGASVELTGGYPGWKPDMDSPILKKMKEVYSRLYGKEPAVMAIHAGLECGILGGAYPNWDMVSCGPNILAPHSPDERTEITSVEKWWNFVLEVIKDAPVK